MTPYIVRECFEQSLLSPDGSPGRACYAIFYDISKAYDTAEWTSISEALKRLDIDDTFIQFIHNSLVGTNLCIKTATKGRTTESVLMHRAVKQGDPLAPLPPSRPRAPPPTAPHPRPPTAPTLPRVPHRLPRPPLPSLLAPPPAPLPPLPRPPIPPA